MEYRVGGWHLGRRSSGTTHGLPTHGTKRWALSRRLISLQWKIVLKIARHRVSASGNTTATSHPPPPEKMPWRSQFRRCCRKLFQEQPAARQPLCQPVKQTGSAAWTRGLQGCRAGLAEHRHETVFFPFLFFRAFCLRSCRILCRSLSFFYQVLSKPRWSVQSHPFGHYSLSRATSTDETPCPRHPARNHNADDVSMQIAGPFGVTCPGEGWRVGRIIVVAVPCPASQQRTYVQYSTVCKRPLPPSTRPPARVRFMSRRGNPTEQRANVWNAALRGGVARGQIWVEPRIGRARGCTRSPRDGGPGRCPASPGLFFTICRGS